MSKLRIIVGQGTATEVYRATVSQEGDWHTIIIGPKGLWAAMPQGHRMGQPPHLLQLSGQELPGYQEADGKNEIGMGGFLDVKTYQQGLERLALKNSLKNNIQTPTGKIGGTVKLPNCRVTSIYREKGKITVETDNPKTVIQPDQVILCTGIGPQQTLDDKILQAQKKTRPSFPWDPVMEGIKYLSSKPPYANDIVIFGGGATAAWVADIALDRKTPNLLWIARPKGSGFKGCDLPGRRNANVLQMTEKIRTYALIDEISFLRPLGNQGPKVVLKLTKENLEKALIRVDQLVYSIGGDSKGPEGLRNMIEPGLLKDVEPVLDRGRALSDGTGVLALATPKKGMPFSDLMIIGSATYNLEVFKFASNKSEKCVAPMSELPSNAQVPDGIAMVNSSITALNDHIGDTNELNLNTGNRNQVAVWVATRYPRLNNEAANTAVDAIIEFRKGETFGINPAKVHDMLRELLGPNAPL